MTAMLESADVVVVGGGPAGAALAARVAASGGDVLVVERQPSWRWRACGVFSSPVTLRELRRFGLSGAEVGAVARPIPRLWVESPAGVRFPLAYGWHEDGDATAVGFDRSRLDPLLLALAARHGARVRCGVTFGGLEPQTGGRWRVRLRDATGEREVVARIVVGADGVGSRVARALGVTRPSILPRVGLTYHIADGWAPGTPASEGATDGRMVVLRGAYCGLAPVPGGRINVGIVVASGPRRAMLAATGAAAMAAGIVAETGHRGSSQPIEPIAGVSPMAHRVARRAGPGWLLVGDAAGFLDPFTGEGLHRALVSARLGAAAVEAALAGRPVALADYDAAMARRFRAKDLVSWVVQAFVTQPRLIDYAASRIARRPALRERLGRVMGDLAPAADAFDPRFLAALLAP